jgi:hypothetical protein
MTLKNPVNILITKLAGIFANFKAILTAIFAKIL